MNVVFVSDCQKRSISRTRRVLDGYASRSGRATWMTPITEEALMDIWRQLKRTASKTTAVACFRNIGRQKMKLLWIVGSTKSFSDSGRFITGTKRMKAPKTPQTIATIVKLARVGGLSHDIGKATRLFQQKLAGTLPAKDPIRHEWVSAQVLERVIKGESTSNSIKGLNWASDKDWTELSIQNGRGLESLTDSLLFIVATHHRMFDKGNKSLIESESFFSGIEKHKIDNTDFHQNPSSYFTVEGEIDSEILEAIDRHTLKMGPSPLPDMVVLRAMSLLARAFLIMADHTVSARKVTCKSVIYANTVINSEGQREFNQSLDYHLSNVGQQAQHYAYHALSTAWTGLPKMVSDHLLEPTDPKSRFRWQNDAVEAFERVRETSKAPALIMNVAGTGAGKTRMNAKTAAALNLRPELRLSTALGLRTLTLQTGDAYRRELNIPKEMLSCIIGDRVARKIHEKDYQPGEMPNIDDNESELEFDVVSGCDLPLPDWLKEYGAKNKSAAKLLVPPVLVSTIDYLVAAGDPTLQGHHSLALLRLINSDLVLDEIDDYAPKSFVAVLRLVEMAAMVGSNVITSSATLPKPMAEQLTQAFYCGYKAWAGIQGVSTAGYVGGIISNYVDPTVKIYTSAEQMSADYNAHIDKSISVMETGSKKAEIRVPQKPGFDGYVDELITSVEELHENHGWDYAGKPVSVGLIRLSLVKNVIAVANQIAAKMPHALIATYHAKDFTISRALKEKTLDRILNRKAGNQHMLESTYLNNLIMKSRYQDIPLIVITSPVEEVGRDHDFDWAVIEPASVRSIVQTAGRVNRHRVTPVDHPNIHILDNSLKCAIEGDCHERNHYCRPGFEPSRGEDGSFPSHSMTELLNEADLNDFSAKLRFGKSIMANLEDIAIESIIKNPTEKLMLKKERLKTNWMGRDLYKDFPLREKSNNAIFILIDSVFHEQVMNALGQIESLPEPGRLERVQSPENVWLCWSEQELENACDELGISKTDGLSISLAVYKEGQKWAWHSAFGITEQ